MSDGRRVLVVFADSSLGGTSRSALTMAAAWRSAGVDVDLCPLEGVHPDRLDAFRAAGRVLVPDEVRVRDYRLLHLHHGLVGPRELEPLARWTEEARGESPPALLTHNVFGVADLPLDRWPGPVAVGVLGEWLADQFAAVCWPRPVPPTVVVPNPQDFDFFRPPTAEEARAARIRLQLPESAPVILRAGSPSMGKWSTAYEALADAADAAGAVLVCVGTPPPLAARLRGRPAVRLHERSSDAGWLRDLYWAADVLALDARQGESFGNVILESLGCGTPVVYRDRPTRDNTPREFPVIVSRGRRRWVDDTIAAATGRAAAPAPEVLARYSVHGVGGELRVLLDGALGPAALAAVSRRSGRATSSRDRLAVAVRHLPPGRTAIALGRIAKRTLRSLRSGRG